MFLEGDEPDDINRLTSSPKPRPTSADSSYGKDNLNANSTRFEQQPSSSLSRKRKLAYQHMNKNTTVKDETFNCDTMAVDPSSPVSSSGWLLHDVNGENFSGDGNRTNTKSEWTEIPTANNQDLLQNQQQEQQHQQQQQQQQHSDAAAPTLGMMEQSMNYYLERADTNAAPAYLDWTTMLSGDVMETAGMVETDSSNNTSAAAGAVAETDEMSSRQHSLEYYQCLDYTVNSACTTFGSTSDFSSYLSLNLNERRHSEIQRRPHGLSLDLKQVSNWSTTKQEKDSSMTPALFSPSFVQALEDASNGDVDVYPVSNTNDALDVITARSASTASSNAAKNTQSDLAYNHNNYHEVHHQQEFVPHQPYQPSVVPHQYQHYRSHSYHDEDINLDMIYQHETQVPSSIFVDKSASNENTASVPAVFNEGAYDWQTRRLSNNTSSTSSSISDSLLTPAQHPLFALESSSALLPHSYDQYHHHQKQPQQQPQQKKQAPCTSSSLYQVYNNGSCLSILDEEEESPICKQRLLLQQLQHRQKQAYSLNHVAVNNSLPLSSGSKAAMYDAICDYLSKPNDIFSGELTVTILTSKVAQKSYGSEKRFLCPPPSITLSGAKWWTMENQLTMSPSLSPPSLSGRVSNIDKVLRPPIIQIQMSNEIESGYIMTTLPIPPGNIEWTTLSGLSWNETTLKTAQHNVKTEDDVDAISAIHDDTVHSIRMNEPIISGRCVSKNMYISDSDEKRKSVEMFVRLQLASGLDLGVFRSKEIRVISKPSKKRQTLKNMELCIHHGSTIALFNRIRSQTVSTRYLGISNTDGTPIIQRNRQLSDDGSKYRQQQSSGICFSSKTQTWDPFLIWIVDGSRVGLESQEQDQDENVDDRWPPPPAMALRSVDSMTPVPVYYNQPVVLQCMKTGLVSPVMIVRKVDYGNSAIGGMRTNNELVTQQPSNFSVGGEYHDECLGDPVSQLHKVAFQIVDDTNTLKGRSARYSMDQDILMSRTSTRDEQLSPSLSSSASPSSMSSSPVTSSTSSSGTVALPYLERPANYLSCMKDVVGIYHTSGQRQQVVSPVTNKTSQSVTPVNGREHPHRPSPPLSASTPLPFSWPRSYDKNENNSMESKVNKGSQQQQFHSRLQSALDDGPVHQKRRVSCDSHPNTSLAKETYRSMTNQAGRRRYSSANEHSRSYHNSGAAMSKRRNSILSSTSPSSSLPSSGFPVNWQEEISETCVWSIVSTDSESYTFWPSGINESRDRDIHRPISPAPYIKQYKVIKGNRMIVHGHGFTNDTVVWFGTYISTMVRVTPTELELVIPNILTKESTHRSQCQQQEKNQHEYQHSKYHHRDHQHHQHQHHRQDQDGKVNRTAKEEAKITNSRVPVLIVREGDGIVYRTQIWF